MAGLKSGRRNLALLVAASLYLAPRPLALARLLTVYLACGYVIVGFCIWQLASKLAGLPFPEAVLYSNPGWSILSDQDLLGVPRISGTFSEPASLAFALCGLLYACAWMMLRGHRHPLVRPLLPLLLLCLVLSTSTTGFVVVAVGMAISLAYGWMVARAALVRLVGAALPVLVGLLLVVMVVSTLLPGVTASAAIVAAQTLAKSDTQSFAERTREDYDAIVLFFVTGGLGIGWGSNRSSSLVPGLMSALGVPGVMLPLIFVRRLSLAGRGQDVCADRTIRSMPVDGFGAATLGSLLTAVVSAPIIVSAMFYLNLAALIAALLQLQLRRRSRLAAVALATVLLSMAPAIAAEPAFLAGVGTHFAQAPQTLEQGLQALRQGGFASLRDEMYWATVESGTGEFSVPPRWSQFVQDAHAQGLRPLLVLDYGNPLYDAGNKPRSAQAIAAFARYAGLVAQRFRNQAPMYEIWNEWNGSLGNTSFGNMSDYLPLLRATATAIKSADPHATVLADGIIWSDGQAGVIEQAIALGALAEVDGLALHPYFYNRGHDHRPEAWAAYLRSVEARAQTANHGVAVPLYITEIGWPAGAGTASVSEALQAAYAVRVYLLARTMGFVRGLWWYDLRDDGHEANFGLLRQDFSPKPAFLAVSDWLTKLQDASYVGPVALPENVVGIAFVSRDGNSFRAVWCADDQARSVRIGSRDIVATAMPVFIAGVPE
jgi:hypothetical protein